MGNQQLQRQKAVVVGDKPTLTTLLERPDVQQSLADVLPKHLTAERVMKMILVAASRQPKLFQCTQASLLQSAMKSAELGLDCSGTLGKAYLVPYYNSKISAYECQFIPGYQGLIDLARRSGHIARIEARVVYQNDDFEVEYGLNQKLVHRPAFTDRGEISCFYAIAELTGGEMQIEVMTRDEVDKIRARSKAGESGPWVSDYPEMGRKTVVRRLWKYLPSSVEMQKAAEFDNDSYDYTEATQIAANTHDRVAALRKKLTPVPNDPPEPETPEPNEAPVDETPVNDLDPETETLRTAVKDLIAQNKPSEELVSEALDGQTPDSADLESLQVLHDVLTKA